MLIVGVWVNDVLISEINIHNTSIQDGDYTMYKIKKPEGLEHENIWHVESKGFESLLRKALKIIEKHRSG
jgi:hypothetical protein